MKINKTAIDGVCVVETTPFIDHRGTFARFFCANELAPVLGSRKIAQINYSQTMAVGAIRGLHFQYPPHAEMKMVRCVRGRVLDVAVDLRPDSPTFLKFHAEELTPANAKMLVVPEGFAHGFQALEAGSELFYCSTAFYEKTAEDGIRHNDPAVGIQWPLPVTDMSERDLNHQLIDQSFKGIKL
mgnify:CR=1 FL=1